MPEGVLTLDLARSLADNTKLPMGVAEYWQYSSEMPPRYVGQIVAVELYEFDDDEWEVRGFIEWRPEFVLVVPWVPFVCFSTDSIDPITGEGKPPHILDVALTRTPIVSGMKSLKLG